MRSRRLRAGQRAQLALEILAGYVRARRLARRYPLPEAVARLRADPDGRRLDADPALAEHLAWATVRTLGALPLADDRCLMQSLVLAGLLHRRGLEGTVHLSVAAGEPFESHAWVEHAGVPLLEPGGRGHRELLRL